MDCVRAIWAGVTDRLREQSRIRHRVRATELASQQQRYNFVVRKGHRQRLFISVALVRQEIGKVDGFCDRAQCAKLGTEKIWTAFFIKE
jgi:hypothetical protein